MTFTYTYRSSDGQRHSAEIDAESRDAAFAKLRRELGIKPIKVIAAGASPDAQFGSSLAASAAVRRLGIITPILAALLIAAIAAWLYFSSRSARPSQSDDVIIVTTPQGPVSYTVATPLPRQAIPGDRQRIESARRTAFTNAAERLLTRFAEPGRAVAAPSGEKPSEAEFAACLREPVRVASTDFTEVVDLKRIVAGMKREMRAYVAGGGTVEQYLSELAKRQKLEASYRENAERRLEELLAKAANPAGGGRAGARPSQGVELSETQKLENSSTRKLRTAYAYWLKANAQLKSMGIYELPLPDALRGYQAGLDLDE